MVHENRCVRVAAQKTGRDKWAVENACLTEALNTKESCVDEKAGGAGVFDARILSQLLTVSAQQSSCTCDYPSSFHPERYCRRKESLASDEFVTRPAAGS